MDSINATLPFIVLLTLLRLQIVVKGFNLYLSMREQKFTTSLWLRTAGDWSWTLTSFSAQPVNFLLSEQTYQIHPHLLQLERPRNTRQNKWPNTLNLKHDKELTYRNHRPALIMGLDVDWATGWLTGGSTFWLAGAETGLRSIRFPAAGFNRQKIHPD